MELSTILLITLALIVALGFAFFQYLFRESNRKVSQYVFFSLRFASVFIILMLLINPVFNSNEYEIIKPNLVVLADNSESVAFQKIDSEVLRLVEKLKNDAALNKNFDVQVRPFGTSLSFADSLSFGAKSTNIYESLKQASSLNSDNSAAALLISDGNQTEGRDYRYFKVSEKFKLYPIIVGDTAKYEDIYISRLNTNSYAYLNNKFPVEVFLNYFGENSVQTQLTISEQGVILHREQINLSQEKASQILNIELPASSVGVHQYKISIRALEKEKNILNNEQNFAIEVIDERTRILLLTDISHPDLGALKRAVESNKQRQLEIKFIDDEDFNLIDYQLIILYQLNRKFTNVFSQILDRGLNYILVTGTETDWRYLNSFNLGISKKSVMQNQEIFPVYRSAFNSFQFEDIGFDDFPPLTDKFGQVEIDSERYSVMLQQQISGVSTGDALMGVSNNTPKNGFLFGENIWRWRAKSFVDQGDYKTFDNFFGKFIQNLSAQKKRDRLSKENEKFYYANQDVIISAQYYDENYQFDENAALQIQVINEETGSKLTSAMILKNNYYEFNGGSLEPGSYQFTINVNGQNLSRSGNFRVIDYNIEQQFISANLDAMQSLSENTESSVYFPDQFEELKAQLLANEGLKPVQKSHQKTLPLIEWYYLLFILAAVLAAEWFYRKYLGLI